MKRKNLSIKVNQDLIESKPGCSKEPYLNYANLELYEIVKVTESDEPMFRMKILSSEELSKFFPNQKVSYKNFKSNILLKQEVKNKIFLQELRKIEFNSEMFSVENS